MTASCLYVGDVRHRRFEPVENSFRYKLFMMYLDLAELPELFDPYWLWSSRSPALAWLRRQDHLYGHKGPFDTAVRSVVERKTGIRPRGPIRLLTHLRYFGYCFNPVSFYYVFAEDGETLETIVAEVNNTPWLEQHLYVLPKADSISHQQNRFRFQFAKNFHVSPFLPMDMDYDWRFGCPAKSLYVHMENYREGRIAFDATMNLRREEITSASLAKTLLATPMMTGKVVALIYAQAFKLWLKKCPYYPHPRNLSTATKSSLQ